MYDAGCLENMILFKFIMYINSKCFYTNHFMYNIIKEKYATYIGSSLFSMAKRFNIWDQTYIMSSASWMDPES